MRITTVAAVLLTFCFPSFALARTFTSDLNLKVFAQGSNGKPDAYLGATSAKARRGVAVPRSDSWYVRPLGSLGETEIADLAKEIREKKIPGLDLSNRWDITDDLLAPLEAIPKLRLLLLSQTKVTDAGLDHVATLQGLRYLSLSRQTTDAGLKRLEPLTALLHLDLHGTKITDKGLPPLLAFPKLESLDVSSTRVSDAGAPALAAMKSLKELDVSRTAIGDKGVQALSELSDLQIFYAGPRLTDAGVKHVAAMKDLRSLDLSETAVTNAGLAELGNLRLEDLALTQMRVDDGALVHVAQIRTLRRLELSETRVTSDGMMHLKRLPRLETLSLSWEPLTGIETRSLAALPNLKQVILNGRVVNEVVLARIRALSKLKPMESPATRALAGAPSKAIPARPALTPARATLTQKRFPQGHERVREGSPPPMADALEPPMQLRRDIAVGAPNPKSKILDIEVGVRPVRGLRRIHQAQVPLSQADPDLPARPAQPIVVFDENPAHSLGEITAN